MVLSYLEFYMWPAKPWIGVIGSEGNCFSNNSQYNDQTLAGRFSIKPNKIASQFGEEWKYSDHRDWVLRCLAMGVAEARGWIGINRCCFRSAKPYVAWHRSIYRPSFSTPRRSSYHLLIGSHLGHASNISVIYLPSPCYGIIWPLIFYWQPHCWPSWRC